MSRTRRHSCAVVSSSGLFGADDAGRVDQHVDRADLAAHLAQRRLVGHVGGDVGRAADVQGGHGEAVGAQPRGARRAEPARAAGHQGGTGHDSDLTRLVRPRPGRACPRPGARSELPPVRARRRSPSAAPSPHRRADRTAAPRRGARADRPAPGSRCASSAAAQRLAVRRRQSAVRRDRRAARGGGAGAVVIQGTDTIEETAFLLDLLHAGPAGRGDRGDAHPRHGRGRRPGQHPRRRAGGASPELRDPAAWWCSPTRSTPPVRPQGRRHQHHRVHLPSAGPLGRLVEGEPRLLTRPAGRFTVPMAGPPRPCARPGRPGPGRRRRAAAGRGRPVRRAGRGGVRRRARARRHRPGPGRAWPGRSRWCSPPGPAGARCWPASTASPAPSGTCSPAA